MPRKKKRTTKTARSSTPSPTIDFGKARDDLDGHLANVEREFRGAIDAHERLLASTHSPRAAGVLFQKQADMRATARLLQRLLERLG